MTKKQTNSLDDLDERYVSRPVLEEEVPREELNPTDRMAWIFFRKRPVPRGNFKTCPLEDRCSVTTHHVLLGFGILMNVFPDLTRFVMLCPDLSTFSHSFSCFLVCCQTNVGWCGSSVRSWTNMKVGMAESSAPQRYVTNTQSEMKQNCLKLRLSGL